MLLSLESIDEGLERFIFVLVHFEEPVPSLLEVVASHCKVAWMPLDFGVDALTAAHIILQKLEDPERPLLSKSARISAQSWTTDMSQICSAVSRSIFSFSPLISEVILRRNEELSQLRGLRSPFSFLGRQMIAQRFDEARVALPKPFILLPSSPFRHLLTDAFCTPRILVTWDRIERSCVGHICSLKCFSRSPSSM